MSDKKKEQFPGEGTLAKQRRCEHKFIITCDVMYGDKGFFEEDICLDCYKVVESRKMK